MIKRILSLLLTAMLLACLSSSAFAAERNNPIDPWTYQSLLDRAIDDCLDCGVIPVLAYQADDMKNQPTQKNIDRVADWWQTVAERYRDKSYRLSFDLVIEVTNALNDKPELLNDIYEQLVSVVRKSNHDRILMISPRLRSDSAYLSDLEIPSDANGYLMAEWHFYAAGPSKTNEKNCGPQALRQNGSWYRVRSTRRSNGRGKRASPPGWAPGCREITTTEMTIRWMNSWHSPPSWRRHWKMPVSPLR